MKQFTVINHTGEPVAIQENKDGVLEILVGNPDEIERESEGYKSFDTSEFESLMLKHTEDEKEFRRALLEKLERLITKLN